jgi:Ion channel
MNGWTLKWFKAIKGMMNPAPAAENISENLCSPASWGLGLATKKLSLLKELQFLQLVLYIIFFLLIFPVLRHDWLLRLFSDIFLLNALLVAISAGGKEIRWKWLYWFLFAGAVVLSILHVAPIYPGWHPLFFILARVFDIMLFLGILVTILAFIFESPHVTPDTIFAAVVTYLIIAFTFGLIYLLLFSLAPQSFNLPPPAEMDSFGLLQGTMVYYSLVIISTLGLGDIVPLTHLARTLTVLEAVTGQFFVAILVAWLVGRFIAQERKS